MTGLTLKAGILGASGYTGADLIRLAACHPHVDLVALTANAHAGKPLGEVFPHLAGLDLPELTTVETADWDGLDVVFCGLPHGTTQEIIAALPETRARGRYVGRFPPARYRHLCRVVRA